MSSPSRRIEWVAYVFVAFFTVPFLVFNIAPTFFAVYLSLTDWKVFGAPQFVGGENYSRLMDDQFALIAFQNMFWYAILIVPAIIVLALAAAIYVHQRWPFSSIVRTAFFAPYVVSATVIGLVWVWMLDTQLGIVNHYLGFVGIGPVPWLTSVKWSVFGVSLASIWWDLGLAFILLLAGLQDISEELYEAAEIDGASALQKFRFVTLPQMQTVISTVMTLQLIATLRIYSQVYLMTNGGPASSSSSVVFYIYTAAIRNQEFGLAAAVSVVFFLLVVMITLLGRRLLPETRH